MRPLFTLRTRCNWSSRPILTSSHLNNRSRHILSRCSTHLYRHFGRETSDYRDYAKACQLSTSAFDVGHDGFVPSRWSHTLAYTFLPIYGTVEVYEHKREALSLPILDLNFVVHPCPYSIRFLHPLQLPLAFPSILPSSSSPFSRITLISNRQVPTGYLDKTTMPDWSAVEGKDVMTIELRVLVRLWVVGGGKWWWGRRADWMVDRTVMWNM
jgi:hypothetical protein